MSYVSFIKRELEIINEDLSCLPTIERLLKIIDGDGHSGGSMSIFSGWFKTWAADPKDITEKDSMLYPISEAVKHIPWDTRKKLLNYCSHAIQFMPLSPLTGEDDEWLNLRDYGDDASWQNRRMGSVFKYADGTVRRNSMVIWAYPGYDFEWWSTWGRGGGHSSAEIKFPYDPNLPENQPITRYFQYDGWEHELPKDVDPNAWLRWQHNVYLKGIDPRTSHVRESAMFVQMDGDVGASNSQSCFFDRLVTVLAAMKYNPEWTRQRMTERLHWLEDGEGFEVEWSEPADESDEVYTYKHVISDTGLSSALARMIALIPEHWQTMVSGQHFFDNQDHIKESLFWDPVEKKEYCLDWRPVWVTDRHYQKWMVVKPNSAYADHTKVNRLTNVVSPDYKEQGTDGDAFYYDKPYHVTGDEDNYLYNKRRELGLAHPPRKLNLAISKDSLDPVAAVDEIVTAFRDIQETNDGGDNPPEVNTNN